MAQISTLPRFVSVNYATFQAGTPVADTLYFISDLGVIYQGNNLVTKGVQISAAEPANKVPGLLYAVGTGTATELVTYDGEGNKSVVAISADAIDAKVKAAKDEIDGKIGNLTAADIAYEQVTDGAVVGENVQEALESIDSKLSAIAGGEDGDSIASLALRLGIAEGEIDQLQTDVAKAQGDATQALADAAKAQGDATKALADAAEAKADAAQALVDAKAYTDSEIDKLDGSAVIATVAGDIVTIKAGITEVDGIVSQDTGADIVLAKVAKTGAAADISVADDDNVIAATNVEGALVEIAKEIDAMDSNLDATGTPEKDGVFVVSGITQVDGVITAVDSLEVEKPGAAAAVEAKLADYTKTADMNAILGGSFTAESTVKAAIDAAENAGTSAAAGVANDINAKLGGNFGTGEGQVTVDAAIKAVDAKFADYSTTTEVEGKINTALASVLKFKGVKATQAELPTEGMVEGDVYFVTEASKEFVYANGKWEELGGVVDYDGLFESYLAPVKADIKTNSDNIQAIIDRMSWMTTMPEA